MKMIYKNFRGEVDIRELDVSLLEFQRDNAYHGEAWILHGWDVKKQAFRDFNLGDTSFLRVSPAMRDLMKVIEESESGVKSCSDPVYSNLTGRAGILRAISLILARVEATDRANGVE